MLFFPKTLKDFVFPETTDIWTKYYENSASVTYISYKNTKGPTKIIIQKCFDFNYDNSTKKIDQIVFQWTLSKSDTIHVLHRLDGPAIETYTKDCKKKFMYCVDGMRCSLKEYHNLVIQYTLNIDYAAACELKKYLET
jgi:hypothetical protein